MNDLFETRETRAPQLVEFTPVKFFNVSKSLDAMTRWRDQRNTFNALLSDAPSVRKVLRNLLREKFKVAPDSLGLNFPTTNGTNFVSLTHLAAFIYHHPEPPSGLDQRAQVVTWLPHQSPLLNLTPTALLDRLKNLNLPSVIQQQWNTYWDERLKGTSVSRRTHAQKQYLGQVKSAYAAVVAEGTLTAQQLRRVKGVLTNPEWLLLEGKKLKIETPLIGGQAIPGALVFSLEGEPEVNLYRYADKPDFSLHRTRQALEEQLHPVSNPSAPYQSVSYLAFDTLACGFDTLLSGLLAAQIKTLEHNPGTDIERHAEHMLDLADGLDLGRRNPTVLTAPPEPGMQVFDEWEASAPSLFDFGVQTLDVPSSIRKQQTRHQLGLMEALDEGDTSRLKEQNNALQEARNEAQDEIEKLLIKIDCTSTDDTPELSASSELRKAHKTGLRAHARIQNILGQISAQELQWIETVLDQGDQFPLPDTTIAAAYPILNQTVREYGCETSTSHTLRKFIVITQHSTLHNQDVQASLLLYCLGEDGGLLHCANRRELESCLGIPLLPGQSLSLSKVTGDVLDQLINEQMTQSRNSAAQPIAPQSSPQASEVASTTLEKRMRNVQVPRHAAREIAYNLLQEQEQSARLAGAPRPGWLDTLSADQRSTIKHYLTEYITAMQRTQALVARDLPNLKLFCRQHVQKHLKNDFPSYDGSDILLGLPESTSEEKVPQLPQPGQPANLSPQFTWQLMPSPTRHDIPIEELLLNNIDTAVSNRLKFLLVKSTCPNKPLQAKIKQGITKAYLEQLAKDLDLAQKYEDQIRKLYRDPDESTFAQQFRRECLAEPLRLMLKLQSIVNRQNGLLNDAGQRIIEIAIDANSAEEYRVQGHDIRLIAVNLSSSDNNTQGHAIALSGVLFITDQKSQITLLYRADHPTRVLQQYPSLEEAREGLYQLSKRTGESDYLASRALVGDPVNHAAWIRQAQDNDFSGIIGLGTAWPSSTSLAEHLLDAQMGRMLEAHRATSRSNNQLWLENYAVRSGMVFNYLKIALGLVPVVGSLIGVYDFYQDCVKAKKLLVNGQPYKALDELGAALMSLIDAAIDLLPGVAGKATAARQLTKLRHLQYLKNPAKINLPTGIPVDSTRLARFAGYEYDKPLSLSTARLGSEGQYRAIYQHSEGQFILVGDRPCQVHWDATAHTWRLQGTSRKAWKRAIALDEHGQWDTHFNLYGVHLKGGSSGGGDGLDFIDDMLGHRLSTLLDRYLPASWAERVYKRQRLLEARVVSYETPLNTSLSQSYAKFKTFSHATDAEQWGMIPALEKIAQTEIDYAKKRLDALIELNPFFSGKEKKTNKAYQADTATILCERTLKILGMKQIQVRQSVLRLAELLSQADLADLAFQLRFRDAAIRNLDLKKKIARSWEDLKTWHPKREKDVAAQKKYDEVEKWVADELDAFFNTLQLMIAAKAPIKNSALTRFLLNQLKRNEDEVFRVRETLLEIYDLKPSIEQRRAVHQQALNAYGDYKRHLQSAHASHPDAFDDDYLAQLYDNLDALVNTSKKTIRRLPNRPKAAGPQNSSPTLFTTVDDKIYIGDRVPATGSQPEHIVMHDSFGQLIGRFEPDGANWRQTPLPNQPDPNALANLKAATTELIKGLDNYHARISMAT